MQVSALPKSGKMSYWVFYNYRYECAGLLHRLVSLLSTHTDTTFVLQHKEYRHEVEVQTDVDVRCELDRCTSCVLIARQG